MGGITSVLAALPAVVGSLDMVSSRANERQEHRQEQKQLEARQRLEEQQAAAMAGLERDRLALETVQGEQERKAALKRAVARQRASFGSQGVGSGGGSSQAVLLGLFDESEAERARRAQMDNLRLRIVDEDFAQRRAGNVLQRTQLVERGKLDRLKMDQGIASRAIQIAGGQF